VKPAAIIPRSYTGLCNWIGYRTARSGSYIRTPRTLKICISEDVVFDSGAFERVAFERVAPCPQKARSFDRKSAEFAWIRDREQARRAAQFSPILRILGTIPQAKFASSFCRPLRRLFSCGIGDRESSQKQGVAGIPRILGGRRSCTVPEVCKGNRPNAGRSHVAEPAEIMPEPRSVPSSPDYESAAIQPKRRRFRQLATCMGGHVGQENSTTSRVGN
jgi:hypothetical protein